jgi:hypothetical protein
MSKEKSNETGSVSHVAAPTTGSAIPESVILDMQERAYQRKEKIGKMKEVVAQKQADYVKHLGILESEENTLREIADFLQTHNADAMESDETWHGALGVPNDKIQP